jgi:nucleoside-specific outer membrane channel protein Tsx
VVKITDRKWRVIVGTDRMDFYKKVAKYEAQGYQLFPNSFNVIARGIGGNVEYFGLTGWTTTESECNTETYQQKKVYDNPVICQNCNKQLEGRPLYCTGCGTKVIYSDNYSQ